VDTPACPFETLIRQFYQRYNARQIREAAELFAPDAVVEHAPFGRPSFGREAYIASAERSFLAFPDAQVEILGIHTHSDVTYDVDLLATGTHQGPLDLGAYGRFEPTGIHVSVRHREVLEIRDGLIAYASVTLDVNSLVAQLNAAR